MAVINNNIEIIQFLLKKQDIDLNALSYDDIYNVYYIFN